MYSPTDGEPRGGCGSDLFSGRRTGPGEGGLTGVFPGQIGIDKFPKNQYITSESVGTENGSETDAKSVLFWGSQDVHMQGS